MTGSGRQEPSGPSPEIPVNRSPNPCQVPFASKIPFFDLRNMVVVGRLPGRLATVTHSTIHQRPGFAAWTEE